MIELYKYDKQWILLTKGQLQDKYPFKGKWINTLKPLFTEIYGWDPDDYNNYNDYLNCIFKKLLSILMKINDNQSYINREIEDVFFASFYKSFHDESELPIERAINRLCGLIQNTRVINEDGTKRFDLDLQ